MEQPELIKIACKRISKEIIIKYNLKSIISTEGHIHCKIQRLMYGLKQATVLDYKQLSTQL